MSGTVYIVYVITFNVHSSSMTKVVVFIGENTEIEIWRVQITCPRSYN